MDLILVLILLMVTLGPVLGITFWLMYRNSFKNVAMIARQTGNDINDVIWIQDAFKVANKMGTWEIKFRKMKEKSQSIDGKFWTKFLKKKDENTILKYSKEEWDTLEMSRHIKRGLFLYESTEGEFYPMVIKNDGVNLSFSIMSQDNRQFLMREIQDINSLTRNKRADVLLLAAIIISIIVLGVCFIAFGYWQNKQYIRGVQETAGVCAEYARNVYNVTIANIPQYLASVQTTPGG